MPSYTGTGLTCTYLREHSLREAAKNNQKITSFFQPRARHQDPIPSTSSADPEPSLSPIPNVPVLDETSVLSPDKSSCSSVTTDCEDLDLDSNLDTNLGLQAKGDHGLPTLDGDADNIKVPVVDFLDTAEDDDDAAEIQNEPVLEAIKRLILEAKKYKSFTSLFYLNMLVQFVELWTKYQQNPRIKGPMCRASHAIAISISKGPYMARKIRSLYNYVERF